MYGYGDVNIGDMVRTRSNTYGKVVGLDSVSLANYEHDKDRRDGWARIMRDGVSEDEERRPDVWYSTVLLLVRPSDGKPYLEATDFPEIVAVDKPGVSFWTKLAALFK